jgi:hypothetical protein
MQHTDPHTPHEWREATEAAALAMAIERAEHYGFMTPAGVDVERCKAILKRAKLHDDLKPGPLQKLLAEE